jgi:hypothetical protein
MCSGSAAIDRDAKFGRHALDSRDDTGHKARIMATKARATTAARAKKSPVRKTAAKPKAPAAKPRRRAPAAEAPPPPPAGGAPRRAVFIDVENTSSEHELARVLDELQIDLVSGNTDVTAIGNWRVVGQHLGRSLAQRGAHLVHSAPATRVPDWSDLWIAVQAGIWLGRSRPGDSIDIVSHDRAFDAVGDAAARLGVVFQRITYRSSAAPSPAAASEPAAERRGGRRRRRRGGTGRTTTTHGTATPAVAHAPTAARAPAHHVDEDEPQAASQLQLQGVIARLAANDPSHTVSLDALTVALKSAGFQRPPGSPRLVTRLRRMKDIEVLPNNRVRVVGELEAAATPTPAERLAEPASEAANGADEHAAPENGESGEGAAKRRPRRRGGRRRGGRGRKSAASASETPPSGE